MAISPVRDVSVTAGCAACGGPVPAGRAGRYCTAACRQDAYRRRHQSAVTPAPLPAQRSRLEGSVYECNSCQNRYLAEQWCPHCARPCHRLGAGGTCPSCQEITLVNELLDEESTNTARKNLPASDTQPTMQESQRSQGKRRLPTPSSPPPPPPTAHPPVPRTRRPAGRRCRAPTSAGSPAIPSSATEPVYLNAGAGLAPWIIPCGVRLSCAGLLNGSRGCRAVTAEGGAWWSCHVGYGSGPG